MRVYTRLFKTCFTQTESDKQVKEGDVLATKLQKLDADYKLQAEQCESISNENQVKAAELKVSFL